jgi:uncharacterized glyoxalase superfamily protein PhnB
MTIKKLTPNLYASDVAACVKFWTDRLGFEKTVEVPQENGLAFAAIKNGDTELMYGSIESLRKELGAAIPAQAPSYLFVEVDNLDRVLAAMEGITQIVPVHKTFYGATEFTVTDPAGHLVTFAQFG